jgi:hypothetical protein
VNGPLPVVREPLIRDGREHRHRSPDVVTAAPTPNVYGSHHSSTVECTTSTRDGVFFDVAQAGSLEQLGQRSTH